MHWAGERRPTQCRLGDRAEQGRIAARGGGIHTNVPFCADPRRVRQTMDQRQDRAIALRQRLFDPPCGFFVAPPKNAAIGRAVSQRCWINTATGLQSNAAKGRNRAGLFGGNIGPRTHTQQGRTG